MRIQAPTCVCVASVNVAIVGGVGPEPDIEAGDAVLLSDDSGRIIAWGVYNPVSMFRVRCGLKCKARGSRARALPPVPLQPSFSSGSSGSPHS